MFVIYATLKDKQKKVSFPTPSSLAVQKRKITISIISSNTFSVSMLLSQQHIFRWKHIPHALSSTV